jgi:chorismate-pyruvate lyase
VNGPLSSYEDPTAALADFCRLFFGLREVARFARVVASETMPPEYRRLLDHPDHMTTRLQEHHGAPVALTVLEERQIRDTYERRIVLRPAGRERIVEVGLVRIHLNFAPAPVRREILARRRPLGDILIQAGVLRRIEPRWFFRFDRPCPLLEDFGSGAVSSAFGRLGTIYCHDEPAVELLEVVTDGPVGGTET